MSLLSGNFSNVSVININWDHRHQHRMIDISIKWWTSASRWCTSAAGLSMTSNGGKTESTGRSRDLGGKTPPHQIQLDQHTSSFSSSSTSSSSFLFSSLGWSLWSILIDQNNCFYMFSCKISGGWHSKGVLWWHSASFWPKQLHLRTLQGRPSRHTYA